VVLRPALSRCQEKALRASSGSVTAGSVTAGSVTAVLLLAALVPMALALSVAPA
jgi:hypothetical protein